LEISGIFPCPKLWLPYGGYQLVSPLMQMDFLHENYEAAEAASLPRSVIYNQYLRYCRRQLGNIVPMNPASFGKLLRLVFTNIKTRRLGTRYIRT